jgi:hypothetical protein
LYKRILVERQRILDELGETLRGAQLFELIVNDESVHTGAKLARESAKDFDIEINARVDRSTRRPAYAEAWLENPAALPTDQRAALYTLWLLDDPPARANLRRCPDCQVLFWADVLHGRTKKWPRGTRKYKYCERHRP